MHRILTCLIFLVGAVLPAHGDDFKTSDGRPVRNIAVLSGLGEQVDLHHIEPSVPITVYTAHSRLITIPGFAIDDYVERKVTSLISARFNVVPTRPRDYALDFGGAGSERATVRQIKALAPRDDVDAYIVIYRDERAVEPGALLNFIGLGLYHRVSLFREITDVYAAYRLLLVDARSGETIVAREGGIETGLWDSSLARKRVDNTRWPGKFAPLPPEGVTQLRDDLYRLMDESLEWTMKELELLP